jgi:hypothetical protein
MKNDHNHDRDSNRASDHASDHASGHANDNGEHERPGSKQVAPAPAGGALTSLAALQTALANVNTAAVIGRSGLPMLLFKREGSGTWMFGQKKTIPEPGSRWAVNPMTFMWGFICFSDANKVVGEHLVPVSQPKPVITDMPNTGFEWQEEWAVNMKCLDGADAGVEVVFKATTHGQISAVNVLIELVRNQLNSGQHDGKIVPVVLLEKDSYPHREHGKVWIPLLNHVDWMPLSGPMPATVEPTPPPVDQPRRRRVA